MLSDYAIIRTRISPPRRRDEILARPRLNHLLGELVEKSQPDEIINLLDQTVPGSAILATLPPADLTDVF